jgi:TM2 domain-containing membrane protein YozV
LKRSSNTPVFVAIVAANIALIFLAAAFLNGQISGIVAVILLGGTGIGILGLSIIAMLTSKRGEILNASLGLIFAAAVIFGAYMFKEHSEAQVMERHYAIILIGMDEEDVKFAECWFDSSLELKHFLERNAENWYMGKEGVKDRREMLDYYYTVKAEGKEDGKTLIDRRHLGSAPAQPEQAELIAFVDEYRTGSAAIESNPKYNLNPMDGQRIDEEEDNGPY